MKFNIYNDSAKKKRFSHRFMLFLSVPIILASMSTYIGNIYYSNHYREMSLSICSNEFNRFLRDTEDTIDDIIGNISFLTSMSETKSVCADGASMESIDNAAVISLQEALLNLMNSIPALDNIMIINRSGDFVVCTSGIYNMQNYFSTVYTFKEYTADFWRNYYHRGRGYEMLPADTATHPNFNEGISVVPAIISATNSKNSMIVYSVSSHLVCENFQSYRFTENSEQYVINSETGVPLANIYGNSTIDFGEINTISSANYYSLGSIEQGKDKFYIISSQPRSNTFGYKYVVKIPYSDIQEQAYKGFSKIMLLGMMLMLLLLLYMYFGSKKLSSPWLSLAKKLDEIEGMRTLSSGDIINDINNAITNLIDKNAGLEQNLAISLPHSQQKYLADILNNPLSISDEAMNSLIFKHEYFISVAINLSLKQAFPPASITLNEKLYSEAYKALESVFAANFLTFSLVGTNNTLYLILNVETDDCGDTLESVSDYIKTLLSADTEYIDVYIGIGNIYKGIDGLRLSHQEALSNIFKHMNEGKIRIFDNSSLSNYSLSIYNENILVNHILTGHGEEAAEFIKNIFTSCAQKSAEVKNQMYTDLFKALYKAVKIKKIRVPDFQSKSEGEIIESLLTYSEGEMLTYFINIIGNISALELQTGKSTTASIVEYIKTNYNEELYLDAMAEKFNTTPKYLSKMLKQHLGISFKAYLTQLRISKAEEMLLDKSLKISEISREVGFFNQSAFIRAFKLKNGISPSEYRSLHTKK